MVEISLYKCSISCYILTQWIYILQKSEKVFTFKYSFFANVLKYQCFQLAVKHCKIVTRKNTCKLIIGRKDTVIYN